MHELYLLQPIQYLHLYVILELDGNSPRCKLVFMSIWKNNFLDGGQVASLHTHSPLNFFIHGYVKDNVQNPAVTGTDNLH